MNDKERREHYKNLHEQFLKEETALQEEAKKAFKEDGDIHIMNNSKYIGPVNVENFMFSDYNYDEEGILEFLTSLTEAKKRCEENEIYRRVRVFPIFCFVDDGEDPILGYSIEAKVLLSSNSLVGQNAKRRLYQVFQEDIRASVPGSRIPIIPGIAEVYDNYMQGEYDFESLVSLLSRVI